MREYRIDDEGDEAHIYFIEDGVQLGAALFPDDGNGNAVEMCIELGKAWNQGDKREIPVF